MNTEHAIERAYRQEAGQVLAALIRSFGDWQLAEDALQDAFVSALDHWARSGVPQRPGAWLTQVARRKALDRVRRDQRMSPIDMLAEVQYSSDALDEAEDFPDERLALICTCCHPALPPESQVPLTLHALGGLTTAEIAHAFLVPLPTMAQRLVRAKRKIKDANIPLAVPAAHSLADRLTTVHTVLYLIFTEGYQASTGESLIRQDLCDEAIRLTRLLTALLARERAHIPPAQHAEALGLLALMLLQHSRRAARTDANGALVLLAHQDRQRWDQAQIRAGLAYLDTALALRQPGPYQTQAAIAALHAQATTPEHTDWPQIVALYDALLSYGWTPIIALNRAVAVTMAHGPEAGLAALDALAADPLLQTQHTFFLARADALRRSGQTDLARAAYLTALDLCHNAVERAAILRQVAGLL